MICPRCKSTAPAAAKFCPRCGLWIGSEAVAQPAGYPLPYAGPATPVVYKRESGLFVFLTLVMYLLSQPIGLIMNIIGLFTGPRRGGFFVLLLLAFLVGGFMSSYAPGKSLWEFLGILWHQVPRK